MKPEIKAILTNRDWIPIDQDRLGKASFPHLLRGRSRCPIPPSRRNSLSLPSITGVSLKRVPHLRRCALFAHRLRWDSSAYLHSFVALYNPGPSVSTRRGSQTKATCPSCLSENKVRECSGPDKSCRTLCAKS
jgi:hypothetical protein